MMVSGNFFQTMGVRAAMGRELSPKDDSVPGRDAVLVLGHDFWEKSLGSDPHVLGRMLRLNGVEFTIVGVAPTGFTGMDTFVRPDLFIPIAMLPRVGTQAQAKLLTDRSARSFEVKGRLKAGVGRSQAAAEMTVFAGALEREYPETDRQHGIRLLTEIQMRQAQSPPNTQLALC